VGKFCENCGYFIPADTQPSPPTPAVDTSATPSTTPASPGASAPASGAAAPGSAQFAVVRDGTVDPSEGFTITQVGEYLLGRTDSDTGSQADVDLRQWVQPLEISGQKQYLVHRKQCYLGIATDGAVTIRACPGAELDTLVKIAGSSTFTPLQTFGTVRNPRPDDTYELEPGDQVFLGDPAAVPLYQKGNTTASGSYLVIELLPRL